MASESSTSASESLGGGLYSKQKSQDFAQQIKQLELEGSKLLEATYSLSGSMLPSAEGGSVKTEEQRTIESASTKTTSLSLSALADISAEQKTIDELRVHLDAQSRETERLQKSLAEPSLGAVRYSLGARSNSLSALNLPFTTSYAGDLGASGHTPLSLSGHTLGGMSSGSAYTPRFTDYNPQTHLERQVKEMQEEIIGLRNRLRQALSLGEEQKQTFRSAQEEIKRQLAAALGTKDSIIEVKTRELAAQEAMVGRLQGTIDRLEQNNRLQEETLLELTRKVESSQNSQYSNETVISQLRKMVADRERRRGRSFSDTESLTSQNPSMLLHHIERYSTEIEAENEEKSLRLRQMSAELDTLKSSSLERHHSISRQHQDRLTELAEAHDKELSLAVERSMQARSQVTVIQEQLSALRQETSQKLADRDDQIAQLKRELESANQNFNREHELWIQRKQALESGMDASQKEIGVLKSDNNEAMYLRAKLESKTEELQQTVAALEEGVKQRQAMEEALTTERAELQAELRTSAQQLEEAQQEVRRLQNLNNASKLESNAQLQTAVAHLEREEKGKAAEQLKSLTERLTEGTERLHELMLQHEVLKAEHKNLQQRHKDLELTHQDTNRRAEAAHTSKEQLTTSLQEQMAEIGRLSQEKDYYLKMSDERAKEIGELRVEIDKLAVQLEERQKNFSLLKEQNDKINHLLESSSDTTRTLREERDKLSEQLSERVTNAEQLRTSHEHLTKKLKIREKHLRDLQEDNHQMAEMLARNKEDVEQLTREKEALYEELKDSRYEVSALKESNTDLESRLSKSEEGLRGELEKVTEKLKATETDLKLAKKAMKTKEHVDGKAVRVAGKMQKEVTEKRGQIDSLQSKVRWLEECFENTAKEKKTLKYESEKLSSSLQRLVAQNERLTSDLGTMSNREKEVRERMNKLEAALEKAAVKHAAAQAQIEQFEQDIARQKLKHQLEIKELVRAGKSSTTGRPQQVDVPQPKVKSVPTTVQQVPTLQSVTTAAALTSPILVQQPLQKSQQLVVDQTSSALVGTELKELIQEMRSLVNSGKQNQQQSPQNYHQQPPLPQHHYQPPPKLIHQKPSHVSMKAPSSSCNTCYSTATTASLDHFGQSGKMYPGSMRTSTADVRPTKLSSRGQSGGSRPPKPKVYQAPAQRDERYTLPSPSTSPVSDLLGDTYKDFQDTVSSITGITDDFTDNAVALKSHTVKSSSDTDVLCKRLEKKLQKLSKLGSHLVEENKEIGEMMKNQDVQLKKVRNAGKLLKA